ncbi:hypothetical protein [Pedobacter sandarakinus]|uniref:hypothetical protein n=1 Tax=Pedobacter sandarakinus TaxID=353156 RepID=UPI0022467CB7|nr:hypothetical protein [Pedobacter sandarakinus]MCX2575959.1 hypothetical protein [Pedobacter sandarakinus]
MKTKLIFILLFFAKNAFTQEYINYARTMSEVKELILIDKFKEGVQLFDYKIFKKYDFIFAQDIFLIAQTAVNAGDIDKAFLYLNKCALQGVPLIVLTDNKIISQLNKDSRWKVFENKYEQLFSAYRSNINLSIRKTIDSLFVVDQLKTKRINRSFFSSLLGYPSWRSTSKRHAKLIFSITKKYGYPGEKLIGINTFDGNKSDSMKMIGNNLPRLSEHKTLAMLLHYFSGPVEGDDKLFYQNLKSGFMPAEVYASYNDFMAKFGKKKYKDRFYNEWHSDPNKEKIQEINIRRQLIGLYPYETRIALSKRRLKSIQDKTTRDILNIYLIN